VLHSDIDLLNPPVELEKQKHKLKRLVQSPNSFFMVRPVVVVGVVWGKALAASAPGAMQVLAEPLSPRPHRRPAPAGRQVPGVLQHVSNAAKDAAWARAGGAARAAAAIWGRGTQAAAARGTGSLRLTGRPVHIPRPQHDGVLTLPDRGVVRQLLYSAVHPHRWQGPADRG
jgi:hypothetical protein